MIDNQVEYDSQPIAMTSIDQGLHIRHGPIRSINVFVIANIISQVILRTFVERTDPNCVDTQRLYVFQSRDDATDITDTITVRVLKACRVDLVDRSIFPPRPYLGLDSHYRRQGRGQRFGQGRCVKRSGRLFAIPEGVPNWRAQRPADNKNESSKRKPLARFILELCICT